MCHLKSEMFRYPFLNHSFLNSDGIPARHGRRSIKGTPETTRPPRSQFKNDSARYVTRVACDPLLRELRRAGRREAVLCALPHGLLLA